MSTSAVQANPTSVGGAATTGTGRVGNLDVLRAVAAFGVLAGHAYVLGGRVVPLRAERWYDVLVLAGASGVWLFFAISGYVIAKPFVDRLVTGRPLPELVPYALKRALRIFPLYWVALTAVIAVAGAGVTALWHYPVHYALLHNLVPGRQGALFSVAWTLTLELLFYIAVPLLALALRRWGGAMSAERLAALVVGSWVASIAFSLIAPFSPTDLNGQVWLRGSLPAMWQMFCPGILLALGPHLRPGAWRRLVVDWPQRRAAVVIGAGALAVATVLGTLAPRRFGLEWGQALTDAGRPLFAVGFAIVIAAAMRSRPWGRGRARGLLHLGLVSYGIYLLHAVLLTVFLGPALSFVPLPQQGLLAYLVHLGFLAGLTIALAMASWRFLELPCIRLARTLSERWRARPGVTRAAEPSRTAPHP